MVTYFNLVPCKGFVWKQSVINHTVIIHKKYNLRYTQTAHSGYTKREPLGSRRSIAPSSIIHAIFSLAFSFIVPYFSLVLFKDIVGKQLTKKYTLKKCTPECTEGALSGCTKVESFRTRWYVLSKTKTCKIITEVFYFGATCFILSFLLRAFFKTVGEPLHLLTVYPKLIFWDPLKKALMVSEERSYQTQYCSKIFPSPLALMLQIRFYLYFLGVSLECALNSCQKCNL